MPKIFIRALPVSCYFDLSYFIFSLLSFTQNLNACHMNLFCFVFRLYFFLLFIIPHCICIVITVIVFERLYFQLLNKLKNKTNKSCANETASCWLNDVSRCVSEEHARSLVFV